MSESLPLSILEDALREAFVGKAFPSFRSDDMARLLAAVGAVSSNARDCQRIGLLTLSLVTELAKSSMVAEKELIQLTGQRPS